MTQTDTETGQESAAASDSAKVLSFGARQHAGKESSLRRAHESAMSYLFEDDPRHAAHWFLRCAAICIRREGQDMIVADVIEAMQRFMADDCLAALPSDRATLQAIVDYYDTIAPDTEQPA